jgi:hypothetical protein
MINDATPIFLNMEGAAVFMGEDVPHPKAKEKGRLLSLNLDGTKRGEYTELINFMIIHRKNRLCGPEWEYGA